MNQIHNFNDCQIVLALTKKKNRRERVPRKPFKSFNFWKILFSYVDAIFLMHKLMLTKGNNNIGIFA